MPLLVDLRIRSCCSYPIVQVLTTVQPVLFVNQQSHTESSTEVVGL